VLISILTVKKLMGVKLFLCLIKYKAMNMYGGVHVQTNVFLTLALVVSCQLHAPAALPPGKKPLITIE
jgi:hypothetical protein